MKSFQEIIKLGNCSTENALKIYDDLEIVDADFMIGRWRGSSFKTEATLDGLLEESGWFGKEFIDTETVHPLLYFKRDGKSTFALNPFYATFKYKKLLLFAKRHSQLLKGFILLIRCFVSTKNPTARLRMVEHRGKVSAAMVYDEKAIIDSFRKVDENTLLGYMDSRDLSEPFFFVLTRVISK